MTFLRLERWAYVALAKAVEWFRKRETARYIAASDIIDARIKEAEKGKGKFEDSELLYAAYERCACGAGMAYPKGSKIHGSWVCSDILTGRATPKNQEGSKTHSGNMPFAFYEVKSEDQPSANGATTRRKV